MYTLQDLTEAEAALDALQKRWDNYSGNNPNKYESQIRSASRRVDSITAYLKNHGQLARTEQETLEVKLNSAFPNAGSRQIVEFEGKKYQKQFYPLRRSKNGTSVSEWGSRWSPMD